MKIFCNNEITPIKWNSIISKFNECSILQTWEWAQFKSKYGWKPNYLIASDSKDNPIVASLILSKTLRFAHFGIEFKVIYLPHGPLLDWDNIELVNKTLEKLMDFSKVQKAAYIKIDPQIGISEKIVDSQFSDNKATTIIDLLKSTGWFYSSQQIQFKNTFWVDLSDSEDDLLKKMKQKTRYNIRLSEKKGVTVREGDVENLAELYEMYAETALRDGFIIRPYEYYFNLWKSFIENNMAMPLIAEVDQKPVSALILFYFNKKSYYLYGMSKNTHREKMPNYLLQWAAIKYSKSLGCNVYDLWGAPEIFNESDRMWGVYKFKEGLGGTVIQTIGAYDYPTSKFTYTIIKEVLPKIQSLSRIIRKKQIRDELTG